MTIQEIKDKVKAIDNQIAKLKSEKNEVMNDLRDAMQAAFEAQHMVKQGDLIKTKRGDMVFYDRFAFNAFGDIVILCHPQKKEGTASRANRHYMWGDFA